MLALRADFWARRLGLISDRAADGYIYLEHGQGSRRFGDLSVILYGPPVAVLGTARLGTKEAAALERVTAPSKPLPLSGPDDLLVHALTDPSLLGTRTVADGRSSPWKAS